MATTGTTEGSKTDFNEMVGLYSRLIACLELFYRANSSTIIHKILLQTDVALAVIFTLSLGGATPLGPILVPLIVVHVLFYATPVAFAFKDGIDTWPHRDLGSESLHLYAGRKRLRNEPRHLSRWWARSGIFVLALPYIVGDMQSRLSGTAPETAEMLEILSPAVPVLQSYVLTFVIALSLLRIIILLQGLWFNLTAKEKYRKRVAELTLLKALDSKLEPAQD